MVQRRLDKEDTKAVPTVKRAATVTGLGVIAIVYVVVGAGLAHRWGRSAQDAAPEEISQNTEAPPGVVEREARQAALAKEGGILLGKGLYKQAQAKLSAAIAVDPDRAIPPLYTQISEALKKQGKSREAMNAMRQAFFGKWRGLESHAEPLVRYARLAEQLGEPDEASRAYTQAVKAGSALNDDFAENVPRQPTQAQTRSFALLAAGEDARRRGDNASSQTFLQDAIRADPRNALAHLALAQQQGVSSGAAEHLAEAARLGKGWVRDAAQRQLTEVQAVLRGQTRFAQPPPPE